MFDPDDLGTQRLGLAEALKSLRVESGLSGSRLAVRAAMSQSKISKIETGKVVPTVIDVERILRALNVPQDVADELLGLARLANTEYHDIRSSLRRGLHYRQQELAALETATKRFRYFLPVMITGLLHIPEYAAASLGQAVGDQTSTIQRRLSRQAILREADKSFCFLFTEAAIRWPLLKPTLMASQIDHLLVVSRLPHVQLGVIPMRACVPDAPLNTFTIYDDRMVTAETIGGLVVMRDPRDVTLHAETFSFFTTHARFGNEARELLDAVAAEFRARG